MNYEFPAFEYAVETPPADGMEAVKWLNDKACQKWRLVSVDSGRCYFERSMAGFYFQRQPDGSFERVPVGPNA